MHKLAPFIAAAMALAGAGSLVILRSTRVGDPLTDTSDAFVDRAV
jgi:hypothetical protein